MIEARKHSAIPLRAGGQVDPMMGSFRAGLAGSGIQVGVLAGCILLHEIQTD